MTADIDPSASDSLDCLAQAIENGLKVEVFFPLLDGGFSDYCGTIEWINGKFEYNYGSHGIGHCHWSTRMAEDMVNRILEDNLRFNSGMTFHIELKSPELTSGFTGTAKGRP